METLTVETFNGMLKNELIIRCSYRDTAPCKPLNHSAYEPRIAVNIWVVNCTGWKDGLPLILNRIEFNGKLILQDNSPENIYPHGGCFNFESWKGTNECEGQTERLIKKWATLEHRLFQLPEPVVAVRANASPGDAKISPSKLALILGYTQILAYLDTVWAENNVPAALKRQFMGFFNKQIWSWYQNGVL